jgi:3-oxoacyl-[acyl-carrier protein] reductase
MARTREAQMKLTDRVAIVTGGGSGIGAASALAFAREGARVLVADIDEAGAKTTVEQIERQGGQAAAARADVARAADNQTLVERAVAMWGQLDVFLANAGVPQWPTDIEDVDETVFDRIMAVNVKGVWLGAKYALPVMKRQRRGVFLITASTAATRPLPPRPRCWRPSWRSPPWTPRAGVAISPPFPSGASTSPRTSRGPRSFSPPTTRR